MYIFLYIILIICQKKLQYCWEICYTFSFRKITISRSFCRKLSFAPKFWENYAIV